MHFSLGQELRQEQKQILTQRMIQSMQILQLPLQQLEERIDQELEANPLLELEGESNDQNALDANQNSAEEDHNDDPDALSPETVFEFEPEIDLHKSMDSKEDFQIADDFAEAFSDTIDELPARSQNWLEDQIQRRNDAFANIASPEQSLQDYLMEQLGWFDLSEPVRNMAERIINNLDPNGYFTAEMEQDFLGEDATEEEHQLFAEALSVVRRLDPAGIGARDLKDCLLLQVTDDIPNVAVLRTLIHSHLQAVSDNRLPYISRRTGFSIPMIQEAIMELKRLSPKPGAEFSSQAAATIVPDVIVEKNDQGHCTVRLEDGRSALLHVNQYYSNMLKNRSTDKPTRDFIKQKTISAQWLIEAIEQRRITLLKVSQAIVDYQSDFFNSRNGTVKPLKMQQIADTIGVHLTTVSRACDEKWMMTPQGVFPLKKFFSGAISSSDGIEEVSQDAARTKLREIIESEDKNDPLSDDAIVKLLEEAGIKVARRTVVKYRKSMNIPNSRGRKSWADS